MNPEVICLDEDYDPRPQYAPTPAVTAAGPSRAGGRTRAKRSYQNGVTLQSVRQQNHQITYTTSDGTVLCEFTEQRQVKEPEPGVFVDGSDVYIIEEIDVPQAPVEEAYEEVPWSSRQQSALAPTTSVPVTVEVSEDEEEEEDDDDEPQAEAIIPEEEVPQIDDYYEVEPLELSEVWNDLITANQEILILLELQDLRHHIVDARKIEDQFTDMACEYCPKELNDIRAWNRHIKKIHFQTQEFECDSCPGKFKYFARYKDHLNSHTGQRPYKCDECDHEYAYRIGFLVHKILEHMRLNGIYVCPKCSLDCKNAQNYKLHIAKHIDNTSCGAPSNKRNPGPASNSSSQSWMPSATLPAIRPSERNQFLDAFESFSKKRSEGLPLRTAFANLPKRRKT